MKILFRMKYLNKFKHIFSSLFKCLIRLASLPLLTVDEIYFSPFFFLILFYYFILFVYRIFSRLETEPRLTFPAMENSWKRFQGQGEEEEEGNA